MPNRRLTSTELETVKVLIDSVRTQLNDISHGDHELLFAYRRKVYKELTYDEREKPIVRQQLKAFKRGEQHGMCAICQESLPEKYCVLDRIDAIKGYTPENTRLLCQKCDVSAQADKNYS